MKKFTPLLLALALLLPLGTQEARAQFQLEVGPRIGYFGVQNGFDLDELDQDPPDDADLAAIDEDFSGLSFGLDVRLSAASIPVQINPTFDFYVADREEFDSFTLWRISTNALYEFNTGANAVFTPYVGPGISFTRSSFEFQDSLSDAEINTDISLNVVGGLGFDVGPAKLFVQGEYTVGGDFKPYGVNVGALFNFDGGGQ